MPKYDCILVPGGGLLDDGSLPPWTIARLEHTLNLKDQCRWFILLSGGTVHKPPPLNPDGFPFFESHEMAKHLYNAGIKTDRLLSEISSYDTIGNAYFARTLFTEPLNLKKMLIVTSEFHMPRTKEIFTWVFNLLPSPIKYALDFDSSPNDGLSPPALSARVQREKNSLLALRCVIKKISTLEDFIFWLYSEHAAYAPNKPFKPITEDELKSY